jgi:putative glutamine amidotransferase
MFDHYHPVSLTQGGVLARRYGLDSLKVNSVHYQGVDQLAPDLLAEAHAPDGLVEAFSAKVNQADVLAVQWHPEWCTADHPQSQTFFALFGAALRGEPISA